MSIWISLQDPDTNERCRPELPVHLRTQSAGWLRLSLIVDTGSDLSIIPIEWVHEYDLTMNLIESNVRSFRTSSGAESFGFRGNLQIKIQNESFSWPCLFSLPSGVDIHQAEDFLQDLLFVPVTANRPNHRNGQRSTTVENWMRLMFPEFHLRPALLGRRGFLDDFEVLICSDLLRVRRRRAGREAIRSLSHRLLRFLRIDS